MNNENQDLTLFLPCIFWLLMFISSIWAGVDSSKIELKKYKSSLSCSPFVLFLGCFLLWIVVFPWYLIVRSNIRSGAVLLKDGMTLSQPPVTTSETVAEPTKNLDLEVRMKNLKELKSLFDDGTIDQETYEKNKKEIGF